MKTWTKVWCFDSRCLSDERIPEQFLYIRPATGRQLPHKRTTTCQPRSLWHRLNEMGNSGAHRSMERRHTTHAVKQSASSSVSTAQPSLVEQWGVRASVSTCTSTSQTRDTCGRTCLFWFCLFLATSEAVVEIRCNNDSVYEFSSV